MVTVTLAPGAAGEFSQIIDIFDRMTTSAAPVGIPNSTSLVLTSPPYLFSVAGTNLSYTVIGTDAYLSGGTITSLFVTLSGAAFLSITNIGSNATALFNAVLAEETGSNLAAIETLLTGLSYDYTGLATADIHLRTAASGDNVALVLRGNDRANLLGGDDHFFSGDGNDTLYGGSGRDTLEGGVGNDQLFGGNANDSLLGESGNDRLAGGGSNDTLAGGLGIDTLSGGLGDDVFKFFAVAETGAGASRDRITDFVSGDDVIDLTGLGLALRGTRGFTGTAPEVRFVTNGVDGFVHIDANGDKAIDGTIMLIGVTALAAGDILV